MPRESIGVNVLEAAKFRIKLAFDTCERVCVSFSAGKDSTVLLHLVMEEAIARDRTVGVLLIDLEAQYDLTIRNGLECFEMYKEHIDPYWVALPIHLRNAVSVYEPFWLCWDPECKPAWVRTPPDFAVTDPAKFPFFRAGMEFEEFVPQFAEWYSGGVTTAFFVGIRTQESYNRYLTIASGWKTMLDEYRFTTAVCDGGASFNFYPIYDWATEDIWRFVARNKHLPYNEVYDRMHMAGMTISQMRICQPYGDDQRKGLWLFHLIEPMTWGRVVARVNGANSGSLYCRESGNITGYRKISKPPDITWKEFAYLLVSSMPKRTQEHYANKIGVFVKWWTERGYDNGIPDEADYDLEIAKKAPSWRRVCKSLLRNDWWCKGLGFTQHRSEAYMKYLDLMRRRREQWGLDLFNSPTNTEEQSLSTAESEQ
jgi:predicted phosphoadenosine phosphosulfate sulfurtransferase